MKTHLLLRWLAVWILVSTALPPRAQLVPDSATNTLANVTTNITVTVGTNGNHNAPYAVPAPNTVAQLRRLLTNQFNASSGLTPNQRRPL